MALPQLTDPSGRFAIVAPATSYQVHMVAEGATRILLGKDPTTGAYSRFRGVYVDDTTPNRNQIATKLRSMIGAAAYVTVGIVPTEAGLTLPGCITLLEWYPWAYDFNPYPLPDAQGFITQWDYRGPGRLPTPQEREALYDRATSKSNWVWIF